MCKTLTDPILVCLCLCVCKGNLIYIIYLDILQHSVRELLTWAPQLQLVRMPFSFMGGFLN